MQAVVYIGTKGENGHYQEFRDIPERFTVAHDWAGYERYLGPDVKLFAIRFTEGDLRNVWRRGDVFVEVDPDEES